jgi:hypothetical protein
MSIIAALGRLRHKVQSQPQLHRETLSAEREREREKEREGQKEGV